MYIEGLRLPIGTAEVGAISPAKSTVSMQTYNHCNDAVVDLSSEVYKLKWIGTN